MPVVHEWWAWLLIAIGVVSGVYGILTGLAQSDLKRLLAYSSVENLGLIAMGLGLGAAGHQHRNPGLDVVGFLGRFVAPGQSRSVQELAVSRLGRHRAIDRNPRSESTGRAGPPHAAVRDCDADRLRRHYRNTAAEWFRQRVSDLSGGTHRPDAVGHGPVGRHVGGHRRRDDFRADWPPSPLPACSASPFSVTRAASSAAKAVPVGIAARRSDRDSGWRLRRPSRCLPCRSPSCCCRSCRKWPIGSWAAFARWPGRRCSLWER